MECIIDTQAGTIYRGIPYVRKALWMMQYKSENQAENEEETGKSAEEKRDRKAESPERK